MGVLEKALAAVSPRMAARREAWRQAGWIQRNYDAAKNDRLNAGWHAQNEAALLIDRLARDPLRAKGRDLERNSDMLNAMVEAIERNVVGAGIKLQVKITDKIPRSADLCKQIESLWEQWRMPENCDLSQDQSLDEMCRLIVRRKHVDGGILILLRQTPERAIPFCLQLIEVDELDTARTESQVKGRVVVDGVEFDGYGVRHGVWLRQYDIEGQQLADSVFVPAKDVIFYFRKTRPSQRREVSQFAPTLSRIRGINSFLEALAIKERIAACFALVITRQTGGNSRTAGRAPGLESDSKSPYRGKRVEPGELLELEPGDSVTPVQPPNSGGGAADIVRLELRMAAAGQGMSYEAVSRDLSQVTYSSARQGLIEDWVRYDIERSTLVDHVLRRVYVEFVNAIWLAGLVTMPDYLEQKAEYLRHKWVPPARRWIDPLKEARAEQVALQSGLETLEDLAGAKGRDWQEIMEQRRLEALLAAEYGLPSPGQVFAPARPDEPAQKTQSTEGKKDA